MTLKVCSVAEWFLHALGKLELFELETLNDYWKNQVVCQIKDGASD